MEACRICRGDSTDGPLMHPCKCTGSIKYVHEDCLVEWLAHSSKPTKTCELCGTAYKFKPIYDKRLTEQGASYKAYIYKAYKIVSPYFKDVSLLLRTAIMLHISAIVLRYTYIGFTRYGDSFGRSMSYRQAFSGITGNKSPYFTSLEWNIQSPRLREFWVASIDGIGLLALTIIVVLMVWMITAWTFHDRILLLEINYLLEHGVELNIKQDASDAIQTVIQDIRNQEMVNPVLREELLAAMQNPQQQNWLADEVRAAANAQFEDEEIDDDEFWVALDGIFGGPLLPRIQGFMLFLSLIVVLIGLVYHIPYILGRAVITPLWQMGVVYLGLPKEQPKTLEFRLFTFVFGVRIILSGMESPYRYFFKWMKDSPTGRSMVVTAKQIVCVEKVFIVVVIEAVIFPLFCGLLLLISFLPVLARRTDSVFEPLLDVWNNLNISLIFMWAVGMTYMFLLTDFFKSCRKFLRPGVLYFVQDPNDPRNEPIRNFLSNSLYTHFKKIGFSAIIYSGLILGCVGSITLFFRTIGFVPYLVSPLNLRAAPGWSIVRYWAIPIVFPFILKRGLSNVETNNEENAYAWIFKQEFERAAGWLDLGSFLFAWQKEDDKNAGNYVRAPIKDNFASRKGMELFVPVTKEDKRLTPVETGKEVPQLDKYTVVWRPKYFWVRVCALIGWIWLVSATLVITILMVPLLIGRGYEFIALIKEPTHNDILHWVVGAFIACIVAIIADEIISMFIPAGALPKLPAYMLSQGFFIHRLVDLTANYLIPSFAPMIHPSETPFISYFFYGYSYFVLVGYRDLSKRLNMTSWVRLLFLVLPKHVLFTLIMCIESIHDQVVNFDEKHPNWRKEVVNEYAYLGETLLDHDM